MAAKALLWLVRDRGVVDVANEVGVREGVLRGWLERGEVELEHAGVAWVAAREMVA